MALIDVSDLLTDPDFVDTGLLLLRATQTVGADGIAVNTTTQTKFTGSVQSGPSDLIRNDAGERVKADIKIYTRTQLSEGHAGQPADVIQWQGRRYTVISTNDYGNFGRGFIEALCNLIPFSGG